MNRLSTLGLALVLSLAGVLAPAARAQDAVTLHSVTLDANDDVTVVFSKNFATCAHLRFSDATCAQNGALTHTANHFCAQGSMVAITVPATAFVAGFGAGSTVYLVHGNNPGVRSSCVDVVCDGVFGAGCAGAGGVPLLGALDACPLAGTSADLTLGNGPAGSLAVLGLGLGQATLPLFGCNVLLGTVLATVVVPFDGQGNGAFSIPLPPGTAGASFTAQAFTLDAGGPQGFGATNGMLVRVR